MRARSWAENLERPLGHEWEDEEVGCEGVNWSDPVQDTVSWQAPVNAVMTFGFYRLIQSSSTVLKEVVGEIIWSTKCK
jgi:hypothetical protein